MTLLCRSTGRPGDRHSPRDLTDPPLWIILPLAQLGWRPSRIHVESTENTQATTRHQVLTPEASLPSLVPLDHFVSDAFPASARSLGDPAVRRA